ncbi:MAG TPA: hypothetical protein ENN05_07490 [Deltaproteobacteria bacterium]|nr:hypothetical protein [Deltaproteobacteria bacterium]
MKKGIPCWEGFYKISCAEKKQTPSDKKRVEDGGVIKSTKHEDVHEGIQGRSSEAGDRAGSGVNARSEAVIFIFSPGCSTDMSRLKETLASSE